MIVQASILDTRKNARTKKIAALVLVNGRREWFPNSAVKDNLDGTLTIDDWIYKKKFS